MHRVYLFRYFIQRQSFASAKIPHYDHLFVTVTNKTIYPFAQFGWERVGHD
jgi:hypothetical protein